MKIFRHRTLILGLALTMFLSTTLSGDDGDVGKPEFACRNDVSRDSAYFQGIQSEAVKINTLTCEQVKISIPPDQESLKNTEELITDFGELVSFKMRTKFDEPGLQNLEYQASYFRDMLSAQSEHLDELPAFQKQERVVIGEQKNIKYFFGNQTTKAIRISDQNEDDCKAIDNLNVQCSGLLEDLTYAINPYQSNANSFVAYNTKVELLGVTEEWDKYLEAGRYQNLAGIILTTVMEKKHLYQDFVVGPPDRKWHALQPNLVIENVSDAVDGNQMELAVAMEWVGVNWWKDSIIGIPFGLSAASVYSDRPGIKDVGHGVMLHFDNKYTIGLAKHGSENGIYISTDLLKLISDKKGKLNTYRDWAEKLR